MRICIVSGTFPPDIGGPPTYLAALIPALAARGDQMQVVTYGEPGDERIPCTIHRISRKAPIPVRLASFTRAVLRATEQVDLLFVSDYGLPPALINQFRGLPMVIKIVGDFAWEFSVRHGLIPRTMTIGEFQTLGGGPRAQMLKWVQQTYVNAAHRVIVPSVYLQGIVAGWGVDPNRVRVVYNAVEPGPAPEPLSMSHPTVATIARLAPWKGVDTLIRAVAALQGSFPDLKLIVIGDGDQRSELEALAAAEAPGCVQFTGAVEHADALRLLRSSTMLALASSYEGLSHVLLEGLAAGRPIIASDIDGNRELISSGVNGWLATPGDVDGFAEAMRNVLQDRERTIEIGLRNRAWACEHRLESLVDRTLSVFAEAQGVVSRVVV